MGFVASDSEEVRRLCEQSLALYRELGDRYWTAFVLLQLGVRASRSGALDEAKGRLEEGLAIGRALGAPDVIAGALTQLAFGWWLHIN
jgi:hypothetical protein